MALNCLPRRVVAAALGLLSLALSPTILCASNFGQTNLVSDVAGLAVTTDPNLKNPWGVAFSATSPFWISDQGSGVATLYNGTGLPTALVVTVPGGATPPTGPTGQVFNPTPGFLLNGAPSRFIFNTLAGTIDAWTSGTTATVVSTIPGAVYTGLALGSVGASSYLYAADTRGPVRVFDSSFNQVTGTTFAGKFLDPNLPVGFVPYNVQLIGTSLYVTYAQLTARGGALPGGIVDVYDTSGNLLQRLTSSSFLYAPWGITLAPSTFGSFGGDLLVGNFGNGQINAFDPITGNFLGTLDGENGQPIVNSGLWALDFRTGGAGVNPNALYFTAGINGEQDGLFGEITLSPEPESLILVAMGTSCVVLSSLRRRRA